MKTMIMRIVTLIVVVFPVCFSGVWAQQIGHVGPYNAITDVPGIEVGQYTQGSTGTTVIIARIEAMGGVDQRGGWPGTINTDVLSTTKTPQLVDAIILTAGSYYGLSTFKGVFDYFRGLTPPPAAGNPLISGAVVYDLGRGPVDLRPDPTFGYNAAAAAKSGPVVQGNVGAGKSTHVGGLKGGVGTASIVLDDGTIVGALVVTNAIGKPYDTATKILNALTLEKDDEWSDVLDRQGNLQAFIGWLNNNLPNGPACPLDEQPGKHTTIGCIATNVILTREQAAKVAQWGNSGLGIAIRPENQMGDGDTVFVLATGQKSRNFDTAFATAVQETYARAIVSSVLNAKSDSLVLSYCDTFPQMCIKHTNKKQKK